MHRKEFTPEERAKRHVLRARLEMWGWILFVVPYMIWLRDSVAVVGLLSVYALVITARGVKAAAEAEVAGYVNPNMENDEPSGVSATETRARRMAAATGAVLLADDVAPNAM